VGFQATPIVLFLAALAACLLVGFFLFLGACIQRRLTSRRADAAMASREGILAEAAREAEAQRRETVAAALAEIKAARAEQKEEIERAWANVRAAERRLSETESGVASREARLEARLAEADARHRELVEREQTLRETHETLSQERTALREALARASGLSVEDARREVLAAAQAEAQAEAARLAFEIKDQAARNARREAQRVLALAIERCAVDHCSESTVTVVSLPAEDMKGRIIGREGRNVRSFEATTGVDVIIDDTPEAVVLSGFDPVRREIARIALEKLVADGRIHPGRIEEAVAAAEQEVDERIREAGERAILDLGLPDLDENLVKLVGQLRYRTSFGQNCLDHSLEVAWLAGVMAGEIGLDAQLAKRAGLLHDVGKAVDMHREGTHSEIGAALVRKYGECDDVINCVAASHGDVEPTTPLAPLIQAADALSGARPGARRESFDTYIKRLADLERIAHSFPGVDKAFAIQAGREIRVIVEDGAVSDSDADRLASEISRRIEAELQYPGQIKVVVIRETRCTQYAR
jgi:ribonuclease Y